MRFTATATTTGNAPLEIELSARDREEKFDLSFSPSLVHLEANTPTNAQLTATPRRPHWIGRPREQTLAVSATAPGVPPPPTQIVAVRQKAWVPFWLRRSCWSSRPSPPHSSLRGPTATMPVLTGETFNAAQLATARAGFTQTPVQQTARPGADRRSARSCSRSRRPASRRNVTRRSCS